MKKLVIMLVAVAAFTHSGAQNSNLTISTTGNTNLKITFAGKKYSLQDRTVTFQALQPGTYPITVFQLQKKENGNAQYVIVYDRNVTLSSNKHTEICVMRFGKVSMDENFIEKDDWNETARNPYPSTNNYGNSNNRYPEATGAQFTTIKNTINGEYSDADKLRMARVVLRNNSFSAVQLMEICNLFYSDANKLEFAKMAYDYCYDPGNYFRLSEAFYSSSTKKEFLDYIGNK